MAEDEARMVRRPLLQAALTCLGATAFCVFSNSWYDVPHLIYDIPAGLATFGFIAQLVIEAPRSRSDGFWLYRAAVVIAMTVATVGRQYGGWLISGHLSCVLAVALVQTADARLSKLERLAYWAPVPIVLGLRLGYLEQGAHAATYAGAVFGLICGLGAFIVTVRRQGAACTR